jgi:hypothetical protein
MPSYLEQKANRQNVFKLSLIGFKGSNTLNPGNDALSMKCEQATAMVHTLNRSISTRMLMTLKASKLPWLMPQCIKYLFQLDQ